MNTKVTGGILLIVGTSIGGGMLALPLVSASSGFISSSLMLFACWVLMTFCAFLMLEVNLWLPPGNNMVTMARKTLGKPGAMVTWISYILLLYSLLAAYISGGSALFHSLLTLCGIHSPAWLDSVLFVSVFGYIVFSGMKPVDYVNRGLMILKLGSLFGLIFLTLPYVNHQQLMGGNPLLVTSTITVMLTSFGFANIIPSLRSYFNEDIRKLRLAILIGSLIPLSCYILWDLVILGALPLEGEDGLLRIMQTGGSATDLAQSLTHYLNSSYITLLSGIFTAICVLTAFLCIALALSDFLADGLQVEKKGKKGNGLIYSLTFLPSLIIVLFYPSIFVKSLSYAGTFCVILVILLPALMVWSGRYYQQLPGRQYQVIGGKIGLMLVILVGLGILIFGIQQVVFT